MATPSLAMIPSAIADSKVYSVLPNNGDGDFTFNRDSSATRIGQNGLIQTVGYFGSEEIINGDFSNGGTNWSYSSSEWSFSSGLASCNGTQAGLSYLNQSGAIVSGKTYKATYEVVSISAGEIRIFVGGVSGIARTTTGIYNEYITAGSIDFWLRGSSTFIGSIDNVSVKEVTGDQPRLNYDISNGVVQSCPSLLLEPASTNLITYSEDFSNGWSYFDSSIVANVLISPSGVLNASKFIEGNGSSIKRIVNSTQSIVSGNSYAFSIFVKKGERDFITLTNYTGTVDATTTFNLMNGTVTSGVGSIESFSNDWFKCTRSFTATATVTSQFIVQAFINNGSGIFYQGDGTSGIYIWGAQFEQLSYATSYIPNFGQSAGVTRAAETCFGAGTASTFNSTEGVLYAEISALSDDVINRRIAISGVASTEFIYIYFSSTSTLSVRLQVGGVNEFTYNHTVDITQNNKVAFKWKLNDLSMYVNGVEVAQSNSSPVPAVNSLVSINFSSFSSDNFYGNTKDIRVFNEALTDLQLQKLTTL